jgi:hypothetical protein
MKKYAIVGLVLLSLLGLAHADSITNCTTEIYSPGIYMVANDLNSEANSFCITLFTGDVVIDFDGKTLNESFDNGGTFASGTGIFNTGGFDNVTIKNGRITGGGGMDGTEDRSARPGDGSIYTNDGGDYTTITNMSFEYYAWGHHNELLQIYRANHTSITDNVITFNFFPGFSDDSTLFSLGDNNYANVSNNRFITLSPNSDSCYLVMDVSNGGVEPLNNTFNNNYFLNQTCPFLFTNGMNLDIQGNVFEGYDLGTTPTSVTVNYRDYGDSIVRPYVQVYNNTFGLYYTYASFANINFTEDTLESAAGYSGQFGSNASFYNSTGVKWDWDFYDVYWWLAVNVSNPVGAPISGAIVNLTELNTTMESAVTGADGIARFTALEAAYDFGTPTMHTPHNISASATGYFDNFSELNVNTSQVFSLVLLNSTALSTPTPSPTATPAPTVNVVTGGNYYIPTAVPTARPTIPPVSPKLNNNDAVLVILGVVAVIGAASVFKLGKKGRRK